MSKDQINEENPFSDLISGTLKFLRKGKPVEKSVEGAADAAGAAAEVPPKIRTKDKISDTEATDRLDKIKSGEAEGDSIRKVANDLRPTARTKRMGPPEPESPPPSGSNLPAKIEPESKPSSGSNLPAKIENGNSTGVQKYVFDGELETPPKTPKISDSRLSKDATDVQFKDTTPKTNIPWKPIAAAAGVAAGTAAPWLMPDKASSVSKDSATPAAAATPTPETPAKTEQPAMQKHKLKYGDTLSQLAQKNKVSVADIAKANPDIKNIHNIMAGKEINMPSPTGNKIYKYGVGTSSGPKSSKDIIDLVNKKEKVNESLLSAFNEIVSSKSLNIFAEAKKKEKMADKDYDKDGKVESAKDEVWGSRFRAAKKAGKMEEQTKLDEIEDKSVVGPGTMTYIDKKTGKRVDYISDVTKNNPFMQASPEPEFKTPNPIPVPKPRPKNLGEGLFSEAELAFLEAIAPTPEDQAPNPSPKNNATGGKGKGSLAEVKSEDEKEEKAESKSIKGTANELHMNAKKAADNMSNVKHKFANGETVNMTKGMGDAFLRRHRSEKTADMKDAVLHHANKSLDAFKHIAQGGAVPKQEKASKISLGSLKGK